MAEKSGTSQGKSPKYVCITRPHHFGKTVMANMVASYFGKGVDSAIQQIKDRRYAQSFHGKLGEEPKCTGRILAVGIAYNRKDPGKRHTCKVEVLRERMA